MTPKQSKEWFEKLPADVRPGVEEMYQAFAARYRSSPHGAREEARTMVHDWRQKNPEIVKAYNGGKESDPPVIALRPQAELTMRRMAGIWRFGLPAVPQRISFEAFWIAVDEWIDQNTQPPLERPWRPTY